MPDGSTNNLTLFDDGLHNDGAPNDGVYATVLGNVQQAGTYSVFYRANGMDSQGQALQRVATGTFRVSTPQTRICKAIRYIPRLIPTGTELQTFSPSEVLGEPEGCRGLHSFR